MAILGTRGTSGTVFAVPEFAGFERYGKNRRIAAEGWHFPVSAFLYGRHVFRKITADPEKRSVSLQRGGMFMRSQPFLCFCVFGISLNYFSDPEKTCISLQRGAIV